MTAPARFSSTEPGGLAGHLDGFVRAVRDAGIPVGISQAVDAAEILTVVDLLDREQLRHGLAAVLLQRAAQRPTYDVLFDLWWPLTDRPPPLDDEAEGDADADGEPAESTLDESAVRSTLGVVLKHASDQDRAAAELRLN